jgi:membrane-associated phospholipid phosphatase
VIWAILCARALWGFKLFRIPLAVLATMIIFSTMTTGWHYFCDVLAGVILAFLSIAVANAINSKASDAMQAMAECGPPQAEDGNPSLAEKA